MLKLSWFVQYRKSFTRFAQLLAFSSLTGCSVYPIPDDVLHINTEDIVRHARCEMRAAVIGSIIEQGFAPLTTEDDVVAFVKSTQEKVKQVEALNKSRDPRNPINLRKKMTDGEWAIYKYMGVAAVYSFDFNITENNAAAADGGFKLPFTTPNVFDLGGSAALNLTRQGQRQFKAGDFWSSLIVQEKRCKDVRPRQRDLIYPLDGSIGIGKVVKSFIDISNQGGAKDSFVDTLIFTTEVGGDVNASVKLNAVPHSFRLVSASASLQASRIDVHKVIISLVFPRATSSPDAITGVDFFDGYLNAPFDRPPDWRARYNLCVADAREREDTFKTLRESPPEIYCISYADAFAPQYGGEVVVSRRSPDAVGPRRSPQVLVPRSGPESVAPRGTTRDPEREGVPPATRSLRPNIYRPAY